MIWSSLVVIILLKGQLKKSKMQKHIVMGGELRPPE